MLSKFFSAVLVVCGLLTMGTGCAKPVPNATQKADMFTAVAGRDLEKVKSLLGEFSNAELLAARDDKGLTPYTKRLVLHRSQLF